MTRDRPELTAVLERLRGPSRGPATGSAGHVATRQAATGQSTARVAAATSAVDAESSEPTGVPWQFGLRTLWLWVSCGAALFALMRWMGAAASVVLAWFLAMVAAHVAATVWGTGARRGSADEDQSPLAGVFAGDARAVRAMPATRLRRSIRVGRLMLGCAAVGVVAGGTLGGWLLMLSYAERGAYVAIAFGATASAVVGGIVAFLASSCLEVTARAFWEALVEAPGGGADETDRG